MNTVIGKMSGVVSGADAMAARGLAPMTPASAHAILVEAFNRILISPLGGFSRGLSVFEEKADLRPFEEAKFHGHNAVHVLGAYVGALEGAAEMSSLSAAPGAMSFLRAALIEESGAALIAKYAGVDALFTEAGFAAYADDLLARMTNPYLGDGVARVARDPARKLGWDDRLVGAMRLALAQGIAPKRIAYGAAAALLCLDASIGEENAGAALLELWGAGGRDAGEEAEVIRLIAAGAGEILAKRARGAGLW